MEMQPELFEDLPPRGKMRRKRATPRPRDWKDLIPPPTTPQMDLDCEGYEDLFIWSDHAIMKMQEALLFTSIRDVCDRRVSTWSKQEVWAWIDRDGAGVFSFRACVRQYDPNIDPDDMRESIRFLARHMAKNEVNVKEEILISNMENAFDLVEDEEQEAA